MKGSGERTGEVRRSILRCQRKIWRKRQNLGKDAEYEKMQDARSLVLGSIYMKPRESGFSPVTPIVHPSDPRYLVPWGSDSRSRTTNVHSTKQLTDGAALAPATTKRCCPWRCPKIRFNCSDLKIEVHTFMAHAKRQVVALFLLLDIICALALLMFRFRGAVGKMEPTPKNVSAQTITVGGVTMSSTGFAGRESLVITGNISSEYVKVSNDRMELARGSAYATYVSIGDITIMERGGVGSGAVEISSASGVLNVAGDFDIAGNFAGTENAQIAGLVFNATTCTNCKWTGQAVLLGDSEKRVPFAAKRSFSDAIGRLVLIGENSVCVNGECHEKEIEESSSESVVSERKLWGGRTRKVVQQPKSVAVFDNERILKQIEGVASHAETVVDLNGRVWDVIAIGNRIHVISGDLHVQTEFAKDVLKAKALLNDLNELILFVMTSDALFAATNLEASVQLHQLLPAPIDFDAVSANLAHIVLAAVTDNGAVSFGACRDSSCTDIHFTTNDSRKDSTKTIALAISPASLPIVGLSDGESTAITHCENPLCLGDTLL